MSNSNYGSGIPKLEPVKKIRLSETIVRQIQSLIMSGQLASGQRLPPERELADELGVSRTSLREALRSLEMMGYIESHVGVGGGTFIKDASLQNAIPPFAKTLVQNPEFIVELLEVVLHLETEMARLAAIHRTPEHIEQLEAATQHMANEIERHETGVRAENQLQQVLADAADNRALKEFVRMCRVFLDAEREDSLRNNQGAALCALDRHREIAKAVANGDAEKSQQLMRRHIVKISDEIKSNIALQNTNA